MESLLSRMKIHLDEVKQLYNLNESDVVCMLQLMITIQSAGFALEHSVRLLKPLIAMMEIILDEKKHGQ